MTFTNRTAEPGTVITFHDRQEGEVELRAGANGVIPIRTAGQEAAADAFGLARTTDAESPAEPTVKDLRARAKELGLTSTGTKAELQERIAAAAPPEEPAAEDAADTKDGDS